eukprot:m.44293 g.44293  ORF g.44293 m.44293 type:complete len:405 (+) comp8515_c0_seq1:23-1237(+)
MGDKGKCLVTGVSGFVGLHTAKALVDAGYAVRGTVRSVERHKDALLAVVPSLELVEVDLDSTAEDWVKAADGCTTCCHVASPFPVVAPKDENELIKPAVEGTTKVLAACKAAGMNRVVVTSSVVAIATGAPPTKKSFSAEDWSVVEKCDPYPKSKTLAERAAREYGEKNALGVSTVNPTYIQGPILQPRESSSTTMCKRILEGDLPMVPAIGMSVCDVRDVAAAHVKALETPDAGGRYIVDSGSTIMTAVAKLLREKFGDIHPIKTTPAPWFVMKAVSFFDSEVASVMGRWKKEETFDAAPTVALLGRPLRSVDECLIEMAGSISSFGLAKKKGEKKASGAAAVQKTDDKTTTGDVPTTITTAESPQATDEAPTSDGSASGDQPTEVAAVGSEDAGGNGEAATE